MKPTNEKIYLSRWNRQGLKIQLLKQKIASLKAERDNLHKRLEETREELAEQREKIYKLMREMGRLEGQLEWSKNQEKLK